MKKTFQQGLQHCRFLGSLSDSERGDIDIVLISLSYQFYEVSILDGKQKKQPTYVIMYLPFILLLMRQLVF